MVSSKAKVLSHLVQFNDGVKTPKNGSNTLGLNRQGAKPP